MEFTRTLVNRLEMPTKCVLVCEDFLDQQANIARHFAEILPPQGHVEINYVSGAVPAAAILSAMKVDLILLDRDMPSGNGDQLLAWMVEEGYFAEVPVIAFSGIPANNIELNLHGAMLFGTKAEIIAGVADEFILRTLLDSD